jgi:hypothetical protein
MASVSEILPAFCTELQDLLISIRRPELADQLPALPIVARCTCGQSNCAHFYTAPPPTGSYGSGHTNLMLPVDRGLVALDLMHSAIVAVEVLDRSDVKAVLDTILPVPNARRSSALACPACGFLTVPETSYGSFNICEVCGWEDDGVQLANPACSGGANHGSLIDAQASALVQFPASVHVTSGIDRSPSWRPLAPLEIAAAIAERDEKYWKNQAITGLLECYWKRHPA